MLNLYMNRVIGFRALLNPKLLSPIVGFRAPIFALPESLGSTRCIRFSSKREVALKYLPYSDDLKLRTQGFL